MTQEYIRGLFSTLLEELEPAPAQWLAVMHDLRREVESSSLPMLPGLAHEALDLTDTICWSALEWGDVNGFCRWASTAASLREFSVAAGLLP